MQVLHEGLADSSTAGPLLVKYVEAGWLGRKTQRGFYDYRGDKPIRRADTPLLPWRGLNEPIGSSRPHGPQALVILAAPVPVR